MSKQNYPFISVVTKSNKLKLCFIVLESVGLFPEDGDVAQELSGYLEFFTYFSSF